MTPDRHAGTPDGPWRVADAFDLCLLAPREDPAHRAALLAELRGAGLPLRDVLTVGIAAGLAAPMADAARRGIDLLVLGAGSTIDAASIRELRRAASLDPMIAGVSPRLDRAAAPATMAPPWLRLRPVSYVPLADLRCLYVKASVLALWGADRLSDPSDWDAYTLRINAGGFRMAYANHASFRVAAGSAGEPPLLDRARRLEAALPGARAALASFVSGAPAEAERVLAGLAPDETGRRIVAFDLTHIGAKRFGTAEVALALIRRALGAWSRDWIVAVLASAPTYAAHFADTPSGPLRIDPSDPMPCAALIRIGQPFSWKEVDAAVRRAPALVFFMLDTIGLDCLRVAPDDLDAVWRFTLAEADALLFNSAFTQRQYERRFGAPEGHSCRASLHSLDTREYGVHAAVPSDGSVLVIGNAFAHKHVAEAATRLARGLPGRPITALGLQPDAIEGVVGYPSGGLDDATLSSLYGRASVVVYPSLYEGFGFPLLEALAHRKPILVRALPPFAEIAAGTPEAANIHVFDTDEQLLGLVRDPPPWIETPRPPTVRRWADALADLRQSLDEAVAAVDPDRVTRRIDFMRGRLTWIRHKAFRDDSPLGEDVDRLSAAAARIAARLVRGLAALPGGRVLVRLAMRAAPSGPPR